ncbi:MAG: helix-turn-helix domain-containing protein [Polyangiaceae bacterium]|nr:helix-turn-helix domain-containing protein [Polyangiaceae bacterium]
MPKPTLMPGHVDEKAATAENRRGQIGASLETVVPGRRRRFCAAEKLRILQAAELAEASGERGAIGALLRREGIYAAQLSAWRKQFREHGNSGLEPQKPGRKPTWSDDQRALMAANKRIATLEKELALASALIELQKKAHELLKIALPRLDEACS